MKSRIVDSIKKHMQEKSDEELLAIWTKNDRAAWSDDAFEAVRQVLMERNVVIPAQQRATVQNVQDQPRFRKVIHADILRLKNEFRRSGMSANVS